MNKIYYILKVLIIPLIVAAFVAGIMYYAVSAYVINEAKKNVINVLLSHRGLHHYIQRVMHPAYFLARDKGLITDNYYNPEILSSSFMVRVLHNFYNEERKKSGLPDLYYKMAAENPRNPVNKGDEHELALLKMFNERRDIREYEEVKTIGNRRFLYYAIPFLETNKACLRCHGNRKDAPPGLQEIYLGMGGFGDTEGKIRAIESLRMPIDDELSSAFVIAGSSTAGTLALIFFVFFNKRLRKLVMKQTGHLETEISEHKKAEEKIRLSLKEKDVLLQEVHHRVKNNMAIISSFLELNMMFITDDSTMVIFRDCLQRIKSMALVHEKLYHSKNLRDINSKEYITEMVDDLISSYKFKKPEMVKSYTVQDVNMNLDMLIPLGLIINEIVSNSLKHAFQGIPAPEIGINLIMESDNRIKLEISDNGTGLPDEGTLSGTKTLGLEIIKALVAQLKGKMEIARDRGTVYKIFFPFKGNTSKDTLIN